MLFTNTVIAQQTTVQIYDGTTIKVGDIIQAGHKPSIYQYNTIKEMHNNYLRDYKEYIPFSKLEIIEIKDAKKTYIPSIQEATLTVRGQSSGKNPL